MSVEKRSGDGRSVETRRDAPETPAESVRLLTYVLSYEDLLGDHSFSFALDAAIAIGRGEHVRGAHHDGPRLVLGDAWASSQHARIERRAQGDVLCDLGSSNGTRVNGRTIREHTLADGDLLEVGHSLLCYRIVDASLASRIEEQPRGESFGPTRTLSPQLLSLRDDLRRLARSDEPVLVLGETGTGKEVVADFVHQESGRTGALRAVDCGAIPEALLESTFFGHRKGAFTGATEARAGEMALAHGGTLFLDEVGNLPLPAQAKLLRALETRCVMPVGAANSQQVDVRFVSATNRELFDSPLFRSDLLRRLSSYVAHLPPLRARREDLGILTAHFLREAGVRGASITQAAAQILFSDPLPGNLRQLRSTLRSAALLAPSGVLDAKHLPRHLEKSTEAEPWHPAAFSSAPSASHENAEADVRQALVATGGNVVQAAKALGVHPRQLYRLIARLGIDLASLRR